MLKEICNAAGKLARFPAPFFSNLPGLFVACDDAHETDPFAPGMATSTGRGERGRVTGSECSAARFGIITPRLPAENGSPDADQSRAATRIALRPHDPGTGEEIDKREVVKGYEYGRGQFVTFTPEELKALDVESSKVIDLEKCVPRGDLDPVYFDSSYYLYPVSGRPGRGRNAAGDRRGNGRSLRPRGQRFARDSPLEGDGFELPVPRQRRHPSPTAG